MKWSIKQVEIILALSFISLVVCEDIALVSLSQQGMLEDVIFRKFNKFTVKYKKVYKSMDEFNLRFDIFKQNYNLAKSMTQKVGKDLEKMRLGTTPFIDLTKEEFAKAYLTTVNLEDLPVDMEIFKYHDDNNTQGNSTQAFLPNENHERNLQSIPASWDWRTSGVVTVAKHQGGCGGCWAFSAAANIEGQYAIKYKKLVSFSVQQMIDCDYTDNGCNGGIMHNAFLYIRNAGGLMAESSYPFIGYRGVCRNNPNMAVAKVSTYVSAGSTNEETLKAFLYKNGPVSITMNASTLQYYQGGVYDVPLAYCPYAPNHGVTLIGYGVTSTGIPYWVIKNSWGPQWGENGFFRIRRGTGLCGVNMYAYSAVLA